MEVYFNMFKKSLFVGALTLLTLTGCGSTPPIQAQEKTISYTALKMDGRSLQSTTKE